MYREGFLMQGKEVVCQTICKYYARVYKKLHIDFKIVTTNDKVVPHYGLLVNGDRGWFIIDPLKDLLANQMGFQPSFFGCIPQYGNISLKYPGLIYLNPHYIYHLAKETNTLPYGHFMNFYFAFLHQEFFQSNFFSSTYIMEDDVASVLAKLSFISKYLINLHDIPGLYEREQYYKYLKSILFNRAERKLLTFLIHEKECVQIFVSQDTMRNQEPIIFYEMMNQEGKYSLERVR